MHDKDWQKAIVITQALIRRLPGVEAIPEVERRRAMANAHLQLGKCYAEQTNFSLAILHLRKAADGGKVLNMVATRKEALEMLGDVFVKLEDHALAIAAWEPVLDITP